MDQSVNILPFYYILSKLLMRRLCPLIAHQWCVSMSGYPLHTNSVYFQSYLLNIWYSKGEDTEIMFYLRLFKKWRDRSSLHVYNDCISSFVNCESFAHFPLGLLFFLIDLWSLYFCNKKINSLSFRLRILFLTVFL